jgi:putative oxidoreductase
MGFQPAAVWASAAAWGELAGGLALAIGLLTPVAAAVLAVDMVVAIWKVHSSKGLWVTQGGYEYALVLLCTFVLIGLNGAPAYSADQLLGLAPDAPLVFAAAFVLGLVAAIASGMPGRAHRQVGRPV